MAVSKRTRFEVLRRDNHACRYCGATAPDVKITVDHVLPVALGGSDLSDNLVAACSACNSGKASTVPSESIVSDVNADAIRWAAARRRAIDQVAVTQKEQADQVLPFLCRWVEWDAEETYLPSDWDRSISYWLSDGLSMDTILFAMRRAIGKADVPSRDVFRYMAGICKNKIAELDQMTRAILEESHGA